MDRSLTMCRESDFQRFRGKAQCDSSLFLIAKLKTSDGFSLPADCIHWADMHFLPLGETHQLLSQLPCQQAAYIVGTWDNRTS